MAIFINIVFLVGGLLLLLSVVGFLNLSRYMKRVRPIVGVVTDNWTEKDSDGDRVHYHTIQYHGSAGLLREKKVGGSLEVGKQVFMLYDPQKPDDPQVKTGAWTGSCLLLCVGGLLLIIAIGCTVWGL
jgi:hypothetical protein